MWSKQTNKSTPYSVLLIVYWGGGHNSLIVHHIIHKVVFKYFDLYVLLDITIKSYKKTAQEIVSNLINKNIFPLKVSSLRQDV